MKRIVTLSAVVAMLLGCSLSEREMASCPQTRGEICVFGCGERLDACRVCVRP